MKCYICRKSADKHGRDAWVVPPSHSSRRRAAFMISSRCRDIQAILKHETCRASLRLELSPCSCWDSLDAPTIRWAGLPAFATIQAKCIKRTTRIPTRNNARPSFNHSFHYIPVPYFSCTLVQGASMAFVEPSSSPGGSGGLGGFITDVRFRKMYRAARERWSNRKQARINPLEYETTALFEDLYNHKFFPGRQFSNISQQPPHKDSRQQCDLVTRYWDPKGVSRTFLFTEAKRTTHTDYEAACEQLLDYCSKYLGAQDSDVLVFGALACGPYIKFFYVTEEDTETLNELCGFMEVSDSDGQETIQHVLEVMKAWVKLEDEFRTKDMVDHLMSDMPKPRLPRQGSRSSPSYGSTPPSRGHSPNPPRGHASPSGSSSVSPRSYNLPYVSSPASGRADPHGYSAAGPSRQPVDPGAYLQPSAALEPRGHSPHSPSRRQHYDSDANLRPAAGSSRQHSPTPSAGRRSSNSPPKSSPSQARQRDDDRPRSRSRGPTETAIRGTATVHRQSRRFQDTTFEVTVPNGRNGRSFLVRGSEWRMIHVPDETGRLQEVYSVDHDRHGLVFVEALL